MNTQAIGIGSHSGGKGDASPIMADGDMSFNHSYNKSSFGLGAKGTSSAILGGFDNNIGIDGESSICLGGNGNDGSGEKCSLLGGSGNSIVIGGDNSSIIGGHGHLLEAQNSVIAGGLNHNITGTTCSHNAIIAGSGSTINDTVLNTVILGGSGLVGDTNNTVYVPRLNINEPLSTVIEVNIGLDSNNFVTTGSTPIAIYYKGDSNIDPGGVPLSIGISKLLNGISVTGDTFGIEIKGWYELNTVLTVEDSVSDLIGIHVVINNVRNTETYFGVSHSGGDFDQITVYGVYNLDVGDIIGLEGVTDTGSISIDTGLLSLKKIG